MILLGIEIFMWCKRNSLCSFKLYLNALSVEAISLLSLSADY